VLTFRNGSGANGQLVVSVGHGATASDTAAAGSHARHLQYLDDATAKLGLTNPARRVFDLELNEIKDVADTPPVPPDIRCLLGPVVGPVWVTQGDVASPLGPLEFIDHLLAEAHAALSKSNPSSPSATGNGAPTATQQLGSTAWVPAGANPTTATRMTSGSAAGVGGASEDDEKWVELKLAVEYLEESRVLTVARKAVWDLAQADKADEASSGLENLVGEGGVLKFCVVENGKEDARENRVTVLFQARKASARGATSAELVELLVLQCTEQVKPSRGRGKRLLWRKPRADGGAHDVRVVTDVWQLHDQEWLQSQNLVVAPTLFLSCGEPFIQCTSNTLALELVGADAVTTADGKAQILLDEIAVDDPRAVIAKTRKRGAASSSVMIFSSLLEIPEPLFATVDER